VYNEKRGRIEVIVDSTPPLGYIKKTLVLDCYDGPAEYWGRCQESCFRMQKIEGSSQVPKVGSSSHASMMTTQTAQINKSPYICLFYVSLMAVFFGTRESFHSFYYHYCSIYVIYMNSSCICLWQCLPATCLPKFQNSSAEKKENYLWASLLWWVNCT